MQALFYKFFVEATDNALLQLMRYTFVGGLAFVVDFGLLYILTEYGHVYYVVSASVSFVVGLLVNYALSVSWVFGERGSGYKGQEFLFFSLIGLVGMGMNSFLLWFITSRLGMYYMASKVVVAVMVYAWNFLARKYLLFSKRSYHGPYQRQVS
ncbi:MAG: GtrA family protein [Mediterranea sp.]|jgi:putative flippase GtrA|nr:GtrA family protein [Mediterranea sp.]